jgi:succinate dehydrogenase/fumarate reductase flavoprotein subunit
MRQIRTAEGREAEGAFEVSLLADVLVIGGGPAGAWAGLAAARAGAKVVLVDKGYVGTSGTQVSAGTNAYYLVPDDPVQRDTLVRSRLPIAQGFADTDWIERVYDESFRNLDLMARWGYAFSQVGEGKEHRGMLRAGDGIFFLRKQLEKAGVTILDHSPVLELVTSDGVAAGAIGVRKKTGERWIVRAGAVVLATGGTAFRSGLAGGHNNTGDGYLFAAEAGAELSGMEFSAQYALVPKGSACTKGAMYEGSRMTDVHGEEVTRGKGTTIAQIRDGTLYCVLDRYSDYGRDYIRRQMPHAFQYFDRHSKTDPFNEPYEIEHLLEGTIRASGGIAVGTGAATTVPGLFAAGDTTSREKLVGATQSGAGPATAWAVASGSWAGHSATAFAHRYGNSIGSRSLDAIGGVGLRPTGARHADADEMTRAVQKEMLPVEKNYRRNGVHMSAALDTFDSLWRDARESLVGEQGLSPRETARSIVKARETVAMIAGARFMYTAALERKESRGLHRRSDYGELDPGQHHHIVLSGTDTITVRRKAVTQSYLQVAA